PGRARPDGERAGRPSGSIGSRAAPGVGPISALMTRSARGPDPEGTGAFWARYRAFFRFKRL
ncbi:MAG: hypothetical protein O7I42_20095, partial [Alphaproteobacteria bacterium]|nr:hypothetical protein [Alphaproteobacteria bacterium]